MKRTLRKTIIYAVTAAFAIVTASALYSCSGNDTVSYGGGRIHSSDTVSAAIIADLFDKVDEEIRHIRKYDEAKFDRITALKEDLAASVDNNEKSRVYRKLIEEYEYYVCDSALKYVEKARELAALRGNRRLENTLRIKRGDIAAHAGLFSEAEQILSSIPRAELDSSMLTDLYWAYTALYKYEYEYLPKGKSADIIKNKRILYADSLINMADTSSLAYITNLPVASSYSDKQDIVIEKLVNNLKRYRPGDRRYSVIASTLASVYGERDDMEDLEEQKRYLALAVISDIKGAIKENMAMRDLATVVFDEGDIERANRLVKVSFSDASFYYSRVQNAQSNEMLPIIDRAYDVKQKKLQSKLTVLIVTVSGLLVIAIAAIMTVLFQMRKVKVANRKVSFTNKELSSMSDRLKDMNDALEKSNRALENSYNELEQTNIKLKNSKRIAEEYAGLFMEYASLTIHNLQRYHLALRNLALQGNIKGILGKLDSGDITTDTLKGFYQKFDEAILNIYPQFVSNVNSLLRPDGQITVKPGEKLNTELRILALIKIGISDSEKISEFLRCSIATIYTYRSKLKKRALNPDTFEQSMM